MINTSTCCSAFNASTAQLCGNYHKVLVFHACQRAKYAEAFTVIRISGLFCPYQSLNNNLSYGVASSFLFVFCFFATSASRRNTVNKANDPTLNVHNISTRGLLMGSPYPPPGTLPASLQEPVIPEGV